MACFTIQHKLRTGWLNAQVGLYFSPFYSFTHTYYLIYSMAQLITRDQNNDEIEGTAWVETIWQRPVQRVFWIYDVPYHTSRGGHHHQSCQMVLHCIVGSVEVYVQTSEGDQHFTLDSNRQYLFLDALDWRLMHRFSTDAILVVLADKSFKTTVYIDQSYRLINLNPI